MITSKSIPNSKNNQLLYPLTREGVTRGIGKTCGGKYSFHFISSKIYKSIIEKI